MASVVASLVFEAPATCQQPGCSNPCAFNSSSGQYYGDCPSCFSASMDLVRPGPDMASEPSLFNGVGPACATEAVERGTPVAVARKETAKHGCRCLWRWSHLLVHLVCFALLLLYTTIYAMEEAGTTRSGRVATALIIPLVGAPIFLILWGFVCLKVFPKCPKLLFYMAWGASFLAVCSMTTSVLARGHSQGGVAAACIIYLIMNAANIKSWLLSDSEKLVEVLGLLVSSGTSILVGVLCVTVLISLPFHFLLWQICSAGVKLNVLMLLGGLWMAEIVQSSCHALSTRLYTLIVETDGWATRRYIRVEIQTTLLHRFPRLAFASLFTMFHTPVLLTRNLGIALLRIARKCCGRFLYLPGKTLEKVGTALGPWTSRVNITIMATKDVSYAGARAYLQHTTQDDDATTYSTFECMVFHNVFMKMVSMGCVLYAVCGFFVMNAVEADLGWYGYIATYYLAQTVFQVVSGPAWAEWIDMVIEDSVLEREMAALNERNHAGTNTEGAAPRTSLCSLRPDFRHELSVLPCVHCQAAMRFEGGRSTRSCGTCEAILEREDRPLWKVHPAHMATLLAPNGPRWKTHPFSQLEEAPDDETRTCGLRPEYGSMDRLKQPVNPRNGKQNPEHFRQQYTQLKRELDDAQRSHVKLEWHYLTLRPRDSDARRELFVQVRRIFHQHSNGPNFKVTRIKVLHNEFLDRRFEQFTQLPPTQLQTHLNPAQQATLDQGMRHVKRVGSTNIGAMWHGVDFQFVNSIQELGFLNFSSTDDGFFSRGIYLSPQPQYAAGYASGTNVHTHGNRVNQNGEWAVLLCFCAFTSCYPVTYEDYNVPRIVPGQGIRSRFFGEDMPEDRDAHYIQVSRTTYQAVNHGEAPAYEEFCLKNSRQIVPRFIVFFKQRNKLKKDRKADETSWVAKR